MLNLGRQSLAKVQWAMIAMLCSGCFDMAQYTLPEEKEKERGIEWIEFTEKTIFSNVLTNNWGWFIRFKRSSVYDAYKWAKVEIDSCVLT